MLMEYTLSWSSGGIKSKTLRWSSILYAEGFSMYSFLCDLVMPMVSRLSDSTFSFMSGLRRDELYEGDFALMRKNLLCPISCARVFMVIYPLSAINMVLSGIGHSSIIWQKALGSFIFGRGCVTAEMYLFSHISYSALTCIWK